MKKIFLMLASLAFALVAGAKEVKVTVAISPVSFAEDSYVKVEGVSSDVTVVINGTECVFDGTTGKWKSGEPKLLTRTSLFSNGNVLEGVPVSVRIPESPLSLADTKLVVADKGGNSIASTLSLSCDGVSVDANMAVNTVAQLKALYGHDGDQTQVVVTNALGFKGCLDDGFLLVTPEIYYVFIFNKASNVLILKEYETAYK